MNDTSKMQALVDAAEKCNRIGAPREAIDQLISAIKLLSQAQSQTMADVERLQRANSFRTDVPIGGAS